MAVREFFHMMQIVDDFDAADERFGALLGTKTFGPKHWSDFDKRWASLASIGPEFVFELMEPSRSEEDLGLPLPKFRARHGQHLHSMSWYYDNAELPAFVERLQAAGVRVIQPYPASEDPTRTTTIFTHPKDTFGQMEFQGIVDGSASDLAAFHLDDDWDEKWHASENPAGIVACSHMTTIVNELDRAKDFYTGLLGGEIFHEETHPDRNSAFVVLGQAKPGRETVVELAQPTDPESRLGRDQAEHGELPHAMTFRVTDLGAAADHAESVGCRILDRTPDAVTIDPDDLFNAVVAFTVRDLPNDPRTWMRV